MENERVQAADLKHIWAATCYLQRCGRLIIVDSDEPVQPVETPNDVQPVA